MVTRENLSPELGLIAGGSLLVDYMLTVAVSVSSGADAITAALPALHPYNLHISIFLVCLLMLLNLRGLKESASSLMIPVYLFIISTVFLLLYGIFQLMIGTLSYQATSPIGHAVPSLSIVLILRAFTSGSASLTGVEAISNAVPFFKAPKEKNAAQTLTIMSLILGFLFAGITFLNYWMGILPQHGETILSQMAQGILGNSFLGHLGYYTFQFSTALILAVAANTGFSAFPMLAYNMAKNKYMPHLFMEKGDRLGYSNGILTLAFGAMILLLIFNGNTERLIPLYTIGVFVPFALSQTGMIRHWKKVAQQLRLYEGIEKRTYDGNLVLVLVGNVTRVSVGAINYAQSIGDEVLAMHISTKETAEKDQEILQEFADYFPTITLKNIKTSYRDIITPTVKYVKRISEEAQKKNYTVTVLVPQFIPNKPWQNILHNQMSLKLKYALRWHQDVVVASYSYHLKE